MKLMVFTVIAFVIAVSSATADDYVSGYTRRDGTYVAPHYRSSPDSSYNNNYSTRGNYNPYTGAQGTNSPTYNDHSPGYNNRTYGDDLRYNSNGYQNGYQKGYKAY